MRTACGAPATVVEAEPVMVSRWRARGGAVVPEGVCDDGRGRYFCLLLILSGNDQLLERLRKVLPGGVGRVPAELPLEGTA